MAAPNIASLTTITGKIATVALANTSANQVVSNASSSGTALKLNSILVANVDGTNSSTITISTYSAATLGGTAYPIAFTIPVPAATTLQVLTKDTYLYLEENMSLGATAANANRLTVTCGYEILA